MKPSPALRRFSVRSPRVTLFAALTLFVAIAMPGLAQQASPPAPSAAYANRQLDDPAMEARARRLMDELRCLQCQSQSIADSDALIAGDMRNQVRERILAGQEPEEIRRWLIARYGDWVSYNPPLSNRTWPLWATPPLLLLAAIWLARGRFHRNRRGS